MMRFAMLTFLLLLVPFQQLTADSPNILLVMVDDLGPADLGCYGSDAVETPRLDAFAKSGMRFTQAYAGCTVCAPTRSVLMTGVHMGQTSVRLNTGGVPLRNEDVTIAEVLQQAGYSCGGFGKWGIGDLETEGAPEVQGFDQFFGYYHQIHAHSYWPDYLIRNGVKEHMPEGRKGTSQGYSHYRIVEETKQFIRDSVAKYRPFFCYAPWCPPHGQYLLPQDDPAVELYQEKPWTERTKNLAAMISMTDRHFGELLDLLDELNIDEETLVIFSSDNGGSEHKDVIESLNPGGALRGYKRSMYEGGIRTPFIVRWPGTIEAGSVSDFIVSHHDIMPTLAEVTGTTAHLPEEVTGISFVPILAGQPVKQRHPWHYWEWELYDWGRKSLAENGLMQALREGDWKLVRHRSDAAWELYYLPDDMGESNDLAQRHPERVRHMEELISQARVPMRPQEEPEMPQGRKFR